MTHREDCREIRQSLGVYVLGAIEPAERAQVDAHLAECPDCREELAGLAGLPALLHRVPVAEARLLADGRPPLAPPPDELLHSLLGRVAGVRRARRWRNLAAAAAVAVLALGAGAAGTAALGGGSPPPAPVAQAPGEVASGMSASTGIHLTVKYRPMAWGTAIAVQVAGVPPGTVCQFRVTDQSGHSSVLGGWQVSYRDRGAWYPLSTAVNASAMRSFQVTSHGKALVTVAAP